MSGKTPGQAAYEAFYGTFPGDYLEWDDLEYAPGRDGWEAAAQAAIDHERLHHGNPLAPAIVTAGTEHLVAELAGDGEGA